MKFNKNFLNLSVVSGINFLNLGLGLIFFTAVAKFLSLEDLGIYSLVTLLVVSLSKLIDFGSNSTYVSEFISRNKNLLNEFLNFKLFSFILTSFLAYLILFLINNLNNLTIYILFVLGLFFYMWNYLFFALFQRDERFVEASLLNLFPALIKAFFGILILLNLLQISKETAIGIFCISMSGSFIVGVRKISEMQNFKINFKILHFIRTFYQAGISQFINDSLSATTTQITKIFRDLTDLGTFSLASKLSNVFSTISYSIFTVILATNSKRKKESKNYNLKESVFIGATLFLIAIFGSFLSPLVFNFLFGNKFDNSILLFNILLFSGAFTATHRFLENYFYIEQKSEVLLRITIIKILFLIILGIWLINFYGLLGLVIADLIVAIFTSLMTIYYINNKIKS